MNKKSLIIPSVLFLLSFFLRLSLISKGPYHIDCLSLALKAELTLNTGQLQHLFGTGYPLTVLLGSQFVFLARIFSINDPVIAVNFMSVLFSSLSVVLVYMISSRFFDRLTGLLSGLVFSLCPIFLAVSVYGKSHTPSLFFLLLSIYFLLRDQSKGWLKDFWLSSLSFGLMGATRLQDAVLVAIPVLFLGGMVMKGKCREDIHILKNLLLYGVFALLTVVLFHLPFLLDSQEVYSSQLNRFWNRGLSQNFRGIFSPSLPMSFIDLMSNLSLIGFLFSLWGLALLFQKDLRIFIFLLLWFLLPLLFYGNLWSSVSRFFLISLIPLILAECYVFSKFMKGSRMSRSIALVIYGVMILSLFSQIYPVLQFRHDNALLPDFARWVGEKTEADAYILAGDQRLFIEHYGRRKTLQHPQEMFQISGQALARFQKHLDQLMDEGVPVYAVGAGLAYNPQNQLTDFLKERYQLQVVGKKLNEDWHLGGTVAGVFSDRLLRILQKQ